MGLSRGIIANVRIVRKILAAALYYIAGVIRLREDMRIMIQAAEEFGSPSELETGTAREHFTALVRTHINWVYAMARRQLGDATLAQDAAQAVFLTLWRHRQRVATGGNTAGWLARTTWRACNDLRKSEHRRKMREYKVALQRAENDKSGDESATDSLRFAELDAAMQRLKVSDRTVLAARFFQALSVPEVAEQLGISQAAAEKRISRAIDRLRKALLAQRNGIATHSGAVAALLAVSAPEAPTGVVRQVLQCVGPNTAPAHIAAMARRLSPHVIRAPVAVGAAVMMAAAIAAAPALLQAHHSSKLIISRATTYITSPLGKDGLPDYKLALKQYLMKGLTPKNNAAVPAIEIAMQGFHASWDYGKWIDYRALGAEQLRFLAVPLPHLKIPRIHSIDLFFKQHAPQGFALPSEKSLAMVDTTRSTIALSVEEGYAEDFPWRSSRCFLLWAAMDRNKAAFAVMRSGMRLKRFYLPSGDGLHPKWPLSCTLPIAAVVRPLGRYILLRSTLELGRGHLRRAWRGAMALCRWAVLVRQIPDAAGAYVSGVLLSEALCVDRVLLGQLAGRPHLLALVWKSVRAMPLPRPLTKQYLLAWRMRELGELCDIYRQSGNLSGSRMHAGRNIDPLNFTDLVNHPANSINWNWQFRRLNSTFDRLRIQLQAPVGSRRDGKLREWINARTSAQFELADRVSKFNWPVGPKGYIPHELERLLSDKLSQNVRYHNALILNDESDFGGVNYHLARMVMLIKTGYALAMYRRDHGRYPTSLAKLAPEYFQRPPLDPKTRRPMFFRLKGDGYELALNKRIFQWHLIPNVPYMPQRIIIPPPAPAGWQKGPFP